MPETLRAPPLVFVPVPLKMRFVYEDGLAPPPVATTRAWLPPEYSTLPLNANEFIAMVGAAPESTSDPLTVRVPPKPVTALLDRPITALPSVPVAEEISVAPELIVTSPWPAVLLSAETRFVPTSRVPEVIFQEDALMLVCIVAVCPEVRATSTPNVVVDAVLNAAHSPVFVMFRVLPTNRISPALAAVMVIGVPPPDVVEVPGTVPTAAK
jgi:hypothetical protein